jgi:hypothetical protein
MPTTATAMLVTEWGAMAIHPKQLLKLWMTADEPATGQLTFSDGTGIRFNAIDLPPTAVDIVPHVVRTFIMGNGPIGTVRACVANGKEAEGSVVINLNPEPVVLADHVIVAKSMPATAIVTLANGDVWSGPGTFPDCPLQAGVATPVSAAFTLTKQ